MIRADARTRLMRAADAVLRAEQCDQVHARRVRQKIDVTDEFPVDTGRVGDQADELAADQVEPVVQQYLDAGLERRCGMLVRRSRRRGERDGACQQRKQRNDRLARAVAVNNHAAAIRCR